MFDDEPPMIENPDGVAVASNYFGGTHSHLPPARLLLPRDAIPMAIHPTVIGSSHRVWVVIPIDSMPSQKQHGGIVVGDEDDADEKIASMMRIQMDRHQNGSIGDAVAREPTTWSREETAANRQQRNPSWHWSMGIPDYHDDSVDHDDDAEDYGSGAVVHVEVVGDGAVVVAMDYDPCVPSSEPRCCCTMVWWDVTSRRTAGEVLLHLLRSRSA